MRLMILQRRFMIQKNIKSSVSETFTFFLLPLCPDLERVRKRRN